MSDTKDQSINIECVAMIVLMIVIPPVGLILYVMYLYNQGTKKSDK